MLKPWKIISRSLSRKLVTQVFVFCITFLGIAAIVRLIDVQQHAVAQNRHPSFEIEQVERIERHPQTSIMETLTYGEHRLVHLDLKGAPPKISYLRQLFPMLKQWGATGLLVEWEDTFPYRGADLAVVGSAGPDSPGVYSQQEVEEILALAAQYGLEVVPLVQTFGHFEFVLKHDVFRSLREVERFPSSLCPSNGESLPVVKSLLSQVIASHPHLKYLHIGADEVWHLGLCDACKRRMSQMGEEGSAVARDRLFLDHVTAVLRWLKQIYPTLTIIMWDDMLRHMDPLLLQEYEMGKLVIPMVWHYRPSQSFHLPHDMWSKYSNVFNGVWVATAFKGASGSNALLPAISQHLDCQDRWLQELRAQQAKGTLLPVRGLALTGWSRYDHYAVMCELLPTGLPSLAACLAQWQAGGFSPEVHRAVSLSLGYPPGELLPLHVNPRSPQPQVELHFPGWKIKSCTEMLVILQSKIKAITDSEQVQSWLAPWLVRRNFTNPMQLVSLCHALPVLLDEVAAVERELRPALEEVLPPLAVEEWFGTVVEPGRESLRALLLRADQQVALGGRIRGYSTVPPL